MKYIDLYLLPIPKENLAAYKKVATAFGKVAREYGALGYREFVGDDLEPTEGQLSFAKAAKSKEGEVVIAAVVDFKSRTHRDQVMKKVFKDARLEKMMEGKPLFNMKKIYYGGFSTIVSV